MITILSLFILFGGIPAIIAYTLTIICEILE
jgi:hypothetical protein